MQFSLPARLVYVISAVSIALSNPTGERLSHLATPSLPAFPLLDNISVEDLQVLFDNGSLTSVNLVRVSAPSTKSPRVGNDGSVPRRTWSESKK